MENKNLYKQKYNYAFLISGFGITLLLLSIITFLAEIKNVFFGWNLYNIFYSLSLIVNLFTFILYYFWVGNKLTYIPILILSTVATLVNIFYGIIFIFLFLFVRTSFTLINYPLLAFSTYVITQTYTYPYFKDLFVEKKDFIITYLAILAMTLLIKFYLDTIIPYQNYLQESYNKLF